MEKLLSWLRANRTTVRLAFMLRLFTMAVNSLSSLAWTRLILRALGDGPYGLLVSFYPVASLGGLGDFGITGALAIRTGQAIARREDEKLRDFLAGARSLMLVFSVAVSGTLFALSPFLPHWLGFKEVPGAGSLNLLFYTAAPSLLVGFAAGYVNALNGGYGTVTWPIIPALLITQIGLAAQWTSAMAGLPLWALYLIQTSISGVGVVVGWWILRVSHPWLGSLRPIRFDLKIWRDLGSTSGWAYLYSLGSAIYYSTDRLLINAGFGPTLVPKYLLNAKLCELSLMIIGTGAAVALPKINQWLASPEPEDSQRAAAEIQRLNVFQTLLGCVAAIAYLALNDWFIGFWLGPAYLAPYLWQVAFAFNLAISASGNAGIQIAGACGKGGLRFTGSMIGLTALLNLGLSFISMKLGSIAGISFATVLAQGVLALVLGWYVCRHAGINCRRWVLRSWLFPLVGISIASALRAMLPLNGILNAALLFMADALLIALLSFAIGLDFKLLRHELAIFRSMINWKH